MIITKNAEIKINKMNINYYMSIGYDVKLKDVIKILTKDLIKGSTIIVEVECDICGSNRLLQYQSYFNNIKRGGFYSCIKCKSVKTKKTNLEKYGVEFFSNSEKAKKTNLEKYGVENVSQSKIIKKKKKETNLKNWGTENVFQSEEIKKISKKTKKEKYGDENYTNREKSKKTCFKNNGVEWPTQSDKVLQKRNLNNKEKYGFEHYTQTEEYLNKLAVTCLQKYGKKTFLGSDLCQEMSRKTCNEKYGVDYPSQNFEIHKKQFPKMKMHETGIKYQGTYEEDFLNLCEKLKIKVKRGKTIKFKYKNKEKIYFSDYFLEDYNLIIEIKSWYIYELHEKLNLVKQKSVLAQGYNFLFIFDKDYDNFYQFYMIRQRKHRSL